MIVQRSDDRGVPRAFVWLHAGRVHRSNRLAWDYSVGPVCELGVTVVDYTDGPHCPRLVVVDRDGTPVKGGGPVGEFGWLLDVVREAGLDV